MAQAVQQGSPAPVCTRTSALFRGATRKRLLRRRGTPYEAVQDRPCVRRRPCCGHARELSAVTNQWVNSYKRLIVGGEAPQRGLPGATRTASALVRVPMYKPGQGRVPAGGDPYPGFGVQSLSGLRGDLGPPGLRGVQEGYEFAAARRGRRVVTCPKRSVRAGRLRTACRRISARALTELENSELVAETLGRSNVYDFFLRNKRVEWDGYRSEVTPVRATHRPARSVALGLDSRS